MKKCIALGCKPGKKTKQRLEWLKEVVKEIKTGHRRAIKKINRPAGRPKKEVRG